MGGMDQGLSAPEKLTLDTDPDQEPSYSTLSQWVSAADSSISRGGLQ